MSQVIVISDEDRDDEPELAAPEVEAPAAEGVLLAQLLVVGAEQARPREHPREEEVEPAADGDRREERPAAATSRSRSRRGRGATRRRPASPSSDDDRAEASERPPVGAQEGAVLAALQHRHGAGWLDDLTAMVHLPRSAGDRSADDRRWGASAARLR